MCGFSLHFAQFDLENYFYKLLNWPFYIALGVQLSGRAIDCRSIGPWFKSECPLFCLFINLSFFSLTFFVSLISFFCRDKNFEYKYLDFRKEYFFKVQKKNSRNIQCCQIGSKNASKIVRNDQNANQKNKQSCATFISIDLLHTKIIYPHIQNMNT